MNNKKAKALRKLVYGGNTPSPRYIRAKSEIKGATNPILNIGDMERVTDSSTGASREIPKRRIYKHLKRISKGLPINQLKRVFTNENTKSTDGLRSSHTSKI